MTDDITRSLSLLAIDNVRMKADIIQMQDKLNNLQYLWKSIDRLVDTNQRQEFEIEKMNKKLLTTQVVLAIVALSAAIAAFI